MKLDYNSYQKNGYLILNDFFQESEIDLVLEDAKSIFIRQFILKKYLETESIHLLNIKEFNELLFRLCDEDIECLMNCGKQIQHLISLHRLSLKNKIIEVLKELKIGSPTICTRPVMYFNHPRLAKEKVYHTVDAHQDWRSMQGSLNSVVLWIPLTNIGRELGALKVLPSSHINGLRTSEVNKGFGMVNLSQEENKNLIDVELKKGDALLFSSFLIHQSGDNITDEPRWSCHFRYNDLDEPTFIQRKYAHPYAYYPKEELITDNFPKKELLEKIFLKHQ